MADSAPESAPAASGPVDPEPLLTVPLKLELDDKPASPRPTPTAPPAALPPARQEPKSRDDEEDDGWEPRRPRRRHRDFDPCPRCREDVRRGAVVCPYCGLDLEVQGDGYSRQRRVRLDAEPHRGSTIFGLGVASIVMTVVYLFPIGIPLGIAAWVMARRDLRKMDAGVMDPGGRRKTRDGKTCGIVGVCINALFALGLGLIFVLVWAVDETERTARPVAPRRSRGRNPGSRPRRPAAGAAQQLYADRPGRPDRPAARRRPARHR